MNPLYIALAGVGIIIAIAFCVSMKPETRLIVAAALCVPQLYVASLPVSVAQIWIVLIGAVSLFDPSIRAREKALLLPAGGLALTYLAYIFWSPKATEGLSAFLGMVVFLILVRYTMAVGKRRPEVLVTLMKVVSPWVVIEAVLVVLFRSSQPLEMAFLRLPIADVLVGPSASGLFRGIANNVLDPGKSGGLFVNANVASMFLGVGVFFLALLARQSGQDRYWFMALFAWTATFFTGSKEAVLLAILLPAIAWTLPRISTGINRLLVPVFVFVALATSLVLPTAIAYYFPSYNDLSALSFGARSTLWEAAGTLFVQHPFIGLGFGGWKEQIWSLTGSDTLPPHNLIISAWASAGLLAATLSMAFIIVVILRHLASIGRASVVLSRQLTAYCFCAWVWVFVHGMGDNTTLFGEAKTMVMLALLLSITVVSDNRRSGSTSDLARCSVGDLDGTSARIVSPADLRG